MADDLILYDFHGSPCARRVRAVLLEKRLRWTTRLVDLTRFARCSAGRLDTLAAALLGRDWLIGDAYSIADLSLAPRVQMYPAVGLGLDAHPAVCAWLARVAARPAFARSGSVQPS